MKNKKVPLGGGGGYTGQIRLTRFPLYLLGRDK